MKDLSQPKTAQKEQLNDNITVFGVLKRALKAKTNPRTLELSKPKPSGGDDDDDEEKPTVNPKARHAKASPRIIELAKPRIITDKFKM